MQRLFPWTSHANLQLFQAPSANQQGLSAGLWKAYQNYLSHLLHTSFLLHLNIQSEQWSRCIISHRVGGVYLFQSCPSLWLLFTVTHTRALCFSYRTYNTRQCAPFASCYLCFPISPLCCVVLPASPTLPYHLQWKSSRLIPAPVGFPAL